MSDTLDLVPERLETERASVLVVVGTDHHPFERLMRWVDAFAAATDRPIGWLVQSGTSTAPGSVRSRAFLARDELARAMAEATVVVCHGGPASIADARSAGHVPIVVPRRRGLGEHVDDHQVRFARRLAGSGRIRLAEDEERFRGCLEQALAEPPSGDHVGGHGDRECERFIALADRLLQQPPRGLLGSLVDRRGGRGT